MAQAIVAVVAVAAGVLAAFYVAPPFGSFKIKAVRS